MGGKGRVSKQVPGRVSGRLTCSEMVVVVVAVVVVIATFKVKPQAQKKNTEEFKDVRSSRTL